MVGEQCRNWFSGQKCVLLKAFLYPFETLVKITMPPSNVIASACGEHSITYRKAESLCCTPEADVTLCVNYAQIKKLKRKNLKGNYVGPLGGSVG